MIKPYLLYGPVTFQVLTNRDGHNISDQKKNLVTHVLWCEEKDLPTALVNYCKDSNMEVWSVWEVAVQPIEIPSNCHECQFRAPDCMKSCPVLGRS